MEPLLLIPGPVPLHPSVQEELAKPARPHYGDEWVKAYREMEGLFRFLWNAPDAHVFPIAGPGHAGLEAIVHTFLRRGDRAVVVSNGFFGDRFREVLASYHVKADVVGSRWGEGPDLDGIRAALRSPAKAVAIVHNETSTGVTNPLEEIVEAAHEAGAFALVDAVSSAGGLPLPMAELGVDAAFTASQKCLAAPAGISPVAIAPALWESTEPEEVEGWYLNLFTWDQYTREWGEWHPTPTTISSNLFYAVLRALQLVREEGLEARYARHAKMAAKLRVGLAGFGFTPVARKGLQSNTVGCFAPPAEVRADDLVRALRERHGIYVSGGLGPLRGKTIRIGTMGTQAEPGPIERLLAAVKTLRGGSVRQAGSGRATRSRGRKGS